MSNTGRIFLQPPDMIKRLEMYDRIPVRDRCVDFREGIIGQNREASLLSDTFFLPQNVQIIQNAIRAGVYKRSNENYVIAPIDGDKIEAMMRTVFDTHSRNLPNNITEQVEALNELVVRRGIEEAYNNAVSYQKYLRDAKAGPVVPLPFPVASYDSSRRAHEMKPWF
jgi:hypothetical protein